MHGAAAVGAPQVHAADLVTSLVAIQHGRASIAGKPLVAPADHHHQDVEQLAALGSQVVLETRPVVIRAPLEDVVLNEMVQPFREHLAGNAEDLVAFLATKTDKTTISRLSRVDWDSVGRICQRVVTDGLDPGRLDGLVSIGVDVVRRATWNELRQLPDQAAAKKFKGARWSLLKRRENLTDDRQRPCANCVAAAETSGVPTP